MSTLLQFVILGFGGGAVYVLLAVGLIVIYRGSGVVNFAHGAVGMVGAYTYYELCAVHNLPRLAGVCAGVAVSALVGTVIQLAVIHRLRRASGLIRVAATLSVLIILQTAAYIKFGPQARTVSHILPTGALHIAGAAVGEDRILLAAIAGACAILLAVVYRFTGFGRATAAVAENPLVAATAGISPNTIAAINWMIGGALAGFAGVMIAPITGVASTSITVLVIPALAAALAGDMTSFGIAFVVGIAMGVAQSLCARYVTTPGVESAIPAAAVVLAVSLRGHRLPARGFVAARLPSVGTGRIAWGPLTVLVAAFVVVVAFVLNANGLTAVITTLASAIMIVSVILLTGYAGQISLAQLCLGGVAALVASQILAHSGVPFVVAVIIGVLATIPVSLVVGIPATRTRGITLALATLGLASVLENMVFNNPTLTGGVIGVQLPTLKFFGWDITMTDHPVRYALVVLAAFLLVSLAVANTRRGRLGSLLMAIRDNESAAAALGVRVASVKLYAFVVAGVIAGLGGTLLAVMFPVVLFSSFTAAGSISLLVFALIAGIGYVSGGALGGCLVLGGVGSAAVGLITTSLENWVPLIGGVLTLQILMTVPDGLAVPHIDAARRIARRASRKQPVSSPKQSRRKPMSMSTHMPLGRSLVDNRRTGRVLEVRDLTVRFGGVTAVDRVSLTLDAGEVLGVIGPNGAGKTTMLEAITGFVKPSEGDILLDDVDVSHWTASRRARAGIGRSFQSLELFPALTIRENLLVAQGQGRIPAHAYVTEFVRPVQPALRDETLAIVEQCGLTDALDRLPDELPYGHRRLAAICRTVAALPAVVLLDEPAAGLGPSERDEMRQVVENLARNWGLSVVIVEHDMDVVMGVCDRVLVLEYGKPVSYGAPTEVRNDPAVVAAYLGA